MAGLLDIDRQAEQVAIARDAERARGGVLNDHPFEGGGIPLYGSLMQDPEARRRQEQLLIDPILSMIPFAGTTKRLLPSVIKKAKPYPRSGRGKISRNIPISETGKGYHEQAYPTSIKVKVRFKDGPTFTDYVKGLNKGHALARAKSNWPGAGVIRLKTKRGSGRDWPDVRLADRREGLAETFLDEHGYKYSHIPGKPNTYTYVDGKIKAYSAYVKDGWKTGVSVKTFNNPTLKSLRDWMGY